MTKRKRKPLPEHPVEATVTGLSHDGRGITQINGKTTFLFNALDGETVQFRYTQQRGRFDEGSVVDVIEPSPDRTPIRCPHFGICGGCSLQHVKHPSQVSNKQAAFAELLQQAEIKPHHWLEPIVAEPWGYRRKARLSVRHIPKKEKVLVGFREKNGRYVANLDSCAVLHPSIGEHITDFSDLLWTLETREQIPQIEIAVDDQETAIILRHLVELPQQDLRALREFSSKHGFKLYLQPKGLDSITLDWPKEADTLMQYALPDYGLTLQFHPAQFIQVNTAINQQMIRRALALLSLKPDDHVLDLFCGIGNFSLPIAQQVKQVVGVEGDESAIQQAIQNAKNNGINNSDFYRANLFEAVYTQSWAGRPFNKILLDPPRAGAEQAVNEISRWPATHIVYVSCNPTTLVRDAAILVQKGYRLEQAGVMDMFPHTQHTEVITLFRKG